MLEVGRGYLSHKEWRSVYVVVRAQTKHDFAVDIAALQPPSQIVVRGSENGG